MPIPITPRSGGHRENGEVPGETPRLAGEIMISKAEAAALSALHLGSRSPKRALDRARAESGFSLGQILRLQARANRAREMGITLRGERFILKPDAPKAPDEPGLLRDDVMDVRSKGAKGRTGVTGQPSQAAAAGAAREAAVVLPLLEAAISVRDFETSLREARAVGFEEAWSDAARAASAAARRSKATGGDWRKAGRKAYAKHADTRSRWKSESADTFRGQAKRVLKKRGEFSSHDMSGKAIYSSDNPKSIKAYARRNIAGARAAGASGRMWNAAANKARKGYGGRAKKYIRSQSFRRDSRYN